LKHLNVQPANESLLEIGMGNGFFVRNILEIDDTVSYTGLDFSVDMISESTRLNEEFIENGRAQFQLGEASNIPFPDNSFDKIFTINTIYFWEDPEKVLSEFKRVIETNRKDLYFRQAQINNAKLSIRKIWL
jgi:ubiquinone/menaquinone biosynthesis C-methylase UbiE